MAVTSLSSVETFGSRESRRWSRLLVLLAVTALAGLSILAMPAQASAAEVGPKNWGLPAGVLRTAQTAEWADGSGPGPIGPGTTFFYQFTLTNNSAEPVTVTGFASNFVFQMHPSQQGDLPLDHCMQFIEPQTVPDRQTYPQTIAVGESMSFSDNATYHYIYGPPSNECQRASFYFGPPSFRSNETVESIAPQWRDASCDIGASVSIPEVEGLQYTINGEEVDAGDHAVTAPQSVTVAAAALDWFELADGMDTEWAHDFDAPECAQISGGVGPTVPSNTHAGGAKLAATGSADATSFWAAGAASAGLGVALLLFGRRRAH